MERSHCGLCRLECKVLFSFHFGPEFGEKEVYCAECVSENAYLQWETFDIVINENYVDDSSSDGACSKCKKMSKGIIWKAKNQSRVYCQECFDFMAPSDFYFTVGSDAQFFTSEELKELSSIYSYYFFLLTPFKRKSKCICKHEDLSLGLDSFHFYEQFSNDNDGKNITFIPHPPGQGKGGEGNLRFLRKGTGEVVSSEMRPVHISSIENVEIRIGPCSRVQVWIKSSINQWYVLLCPHKDYLLVYHDFWFRVLLLDLVYSFKRLACVSKSSFAHFLKFFRTKKKEGLYKYFEVADFVMERKFLDSNLPESFNLFRETFEKYCSEHRVLENEDRMHLRRCKCIAHVFLDQQKQMQEKMNAIKEMIRNEVREERVRDDMESEDAKDEFIKCLENDRTIILNQFSGGDFLKYYVNSSCNHLRISDFISKTETEIKKKKIKKRKFNSIQNQNQNQYQN